MTAETAGVITPEQIVAQLRAEVASVRAEIAETRAELDELRQDIADFADFAEGGVE